ncbi:MAG: 4Fe-4S binding protein [Promethearchaeota archaeon]
MKDEKLYPISINANLCVRCERCMYSCPQKAIFFKYSIRYVNYDKCRGCLKCVSVCEHGAIEVISIEQGKLKGFLIDSDKCNICKLCLMEDFCFQNLFELQRERDGREWIKFRNTDLSECYRCLKCFRSCPNNAILLEID